MNEDGSVRTRTHWTDPEVRFIGRLPEIVAGGGGKITVGRDIEGRRGHGGG